LRRGPRRGDSDVVSTAMTLSVVVAIGLGMLGLLSSYSSIGRQEAVQSLNKDSLVLRSMLGADYVYFPDWRIPEEAGYGVARFRNVGYERITIFRIIVYRNGSLAYDSGLDPSRFVTLNVAEVAEVSFRCPGCRRGDPILVTAHYLPTALIRPGDPGSIEALLRTELFKVSSFEAATPRAGLSESCPPPSSWIFVELVDPVESAALENGELVFVVNNEVKLRLLMASDRVLDTNIDVKILDGGGNLAGGAIHVSGEPPMEIRVPLSGQTLRYPMTVSITSDDYTILPQIWRYDVAGDVIFPDYAKLNVDLLNRLANSFLVSAYSTDQATVQVTLAIRDCVSSYTTGGRLLLDFDPQGVMYQVSQGTYHLNPPTSILNLYEVSIEYVDVTDVEVVWVTLTTTVTATATATTTKTTSTTVPSTTRTLTSTTTTTTTRTVYTSTTTTTSTRTITSTSTSSTTTTTTVTTTTATFTSYTSTRWVTLTRTSTSYTTTSTVRATSSTTQTSTLYSPTATTTITQTTTSYTATYTVTATATSTSTARTTVTTTTTTTTTISRAGGAVPVLPVGAGTVNSGYEALMAMGGAVAASAGLAPLLWRLARRMEVNAL